MVFCVILAALLCAVDALEVNVTDAVVMLNLIGAQGVVKTVPAKPAAWNMRLPNFGKPLLSDTTPLDQESCNVTSGFNGRLVKAAGDTLGCGAVLSAPPRGDLAVLVERGRCTFKEKTWNAFQGGYKALIVSNLAPLPSAENLPDMETTPGVDKEVQIPAWIVTREDGDALRSWLLTDHSIQLQVYDSNPRPQLGTLQADNFGLRSYQTS
eukprot:gnl/MRDRNA2_/MRDRNA2_31285_c0_seq1.p1 gnl/MRDRNA2_/MRDRNA2_31285_c0~~gnl/MRDRNA2_/MRDRNA2_31285_c0_seq1.p1  ORF type:complete len:210 (+),score=41.21 gnl/MRDRNA2_/MRDRNA2_31285_c0_seq1:68-697(+)